MNQNPPPRPPEDRARTDAGRTADEELSPWIFWAPWGLAACFAILCVTLLWLDDSRRGEVDRLRLELTQRADESAGLQQQLDVLRARVEQQRTNYQDRLVEVQKQVVERIAELNRQSQQFTNRLNHQQAELRRQLTHYRTQAEQLRHDNRLLNDALAVVGTGDKDRLSLARVSLLRPAGEAFANALGACVWSAQDQRGVLAAEGLPALPASQNYQLWLFDPKLPAPISGGVIPLTTGGNARLQFTPATATTTRVESVEKFTVTIEPRTGATKPTGKVALSGT